MILINRTPLLVSTSSVIFLDNTQQLGVINFGASSGPPLNMRFEGGHLHSSETRTVSKSRRFTKVNIQMQKTEIWDQNPASRYGIYVNK